MDAPSPLSAEIAATIVPNRGAPAASASTSQPTETATIDLEALAEQLSVAYQLQAKGAVEEAKPLFSNVARILSNAGLFRRELPEHPIIVPGTAVAGLTLGWNTLFFDPTTGKPLSFVPNEPLSWGAPPLANGYFAVGKGPITYGLYRPEVLGGMQNFVEHTWLVALHPNGLQAYILTPCRLVEWRLDQDKTGWVLASGTSSVREQAKGHCGRNFWLFDEMRGLGSAAVTNDGHFLVTSWGRWNLVNGQHIPWPWLPDPYLAVSHDGRYVARVVVNPKYRGGPAVRAGGLDYHLLELSDLESGAKRRRPIGMLTNPSALSFLSSPVRLSVFDYGTEILAVPSLESLESCLSGCSTMLEFCHCPHPPEHPKLLQRVLSHVCIVAGFPLPLAYCQS